MNWFHSYLQSSGIVERISKIPNPIKSYFQGLKNKESSDTFSLQDASIFNVDDLQIPDSYIKPGTVNKINKPIDVVNSVQKKRPTVRPRPSSTRPRPSSSTRPRPSSTRPRPSSTRPRPSSSSNLKRKPTTKRPKIKTEASVIPPDSGSLPVTGAHAVVATHMGEISVFTSEGRLWLNGPNIPKPVPLGSALDSDSIAVSNKDAYHIWVNTTSWYRLVSLEEIRNRRRPIVLDNDPKSRKKAILERKPLPRSTTTESPLPLRIKGTYQYGNGIEKWWCHRLIWLIQIPSTDTCGLNIIIPLTADRKILMEQAIRPNYKSTGFPEERDYPLACTWNVKVYFAEFIVLVSVLNLCQLILSRWIKSVVVLVSRWKWMNEVDCRMKRNALKDTYEFLLSWTKQSNETHFHWFSCSFLLFDLSFSLEKNLRTNRQYSSLSLVRWRSKTQWRHHHNEEYRDQRWFLRGNVVHSSRWVSLTSTTTTNRQKSNQLSSHQTIRWMPSDRKGNVWRQPGKQRRLFQLDGSSLDGSFCYRTRRNNIHSIRYAHVTWPAHFTSPSPRRHEPTFRIYSNRPRRPKCWWRFKL